MPLLVYYPSYTLFDPLPGSSSDERLHPLDLTAFVQVADYRPVASSLASGYELRLQAHSVKAFPTRLSTLHLHFLLCFKVLCFYEVLKGRSVPLRYLSGSERPGPDCGTERDSGYHKL